MSLALDFTKERRYFTYMFPSTYSQLSASAMTLPLKVAVAWGILSVSLCLCLRVVSFGMIFSLYLTGKSMGHVGVFMLLHSLLLFCGSLRASKVE